MRNIAVGASACAMPTRADRVSVTGGGAEPIVYKLLHATSMQLRLCEIKKNIKYVKFNAVED